MANLLQKVLGFVESEEEEKRVKKDYPTYTKDPSGLTGVARYLAHEVEPDVQGQAVQVASGKTGVAKYLAKLEGVEIEDAIVPLTGVEKYLAKMANESDEWTAGGAVAAEPEEPLTGVAKYLAQQAGKKKT